MTEDTKKFESLSYEPECECTACKLEEAVKGPGSKGLPLRLKTEARGYEEQPVKLSSAPMGFNSHVIKPETRVNNSEVADQHPEPTVKKEDCDWPACTCDDFNCPEKPTEQPNQPIEYPEMCENTKKIIKACKQVIQSADDYDNDTMTTPITVVQACEQLNCVLEKLRNEAEQGMKKMGFEQPNQNLMIFEQVEGSIKIALELLGKLETSNTMRDAEKEGCIWTLDGWRKYNLKHLRNAFE